MKKSLVILALVLGCISMVFSAIVTNTNQSATYLRLFSRNASTDLDAVYYNPAGLTKLSNGFHLALHNQTIFQEKTVINNYPFLNDYNYVGKVKVPIYPNFYFVYKMNRLALSFGFGPNAGGGSADYSRGLPSFETQISTLPMMVTQMTGIPTTKYSTDIAFKGSSVYYGFQLNASYAINDMFSGAAGVRYIYALNSYKGHIKNVMINPGGVMMPAVQFFQSIGATTYAAMVSDKEVDAEQVGSGFTPLLSLHATPIKGLNIGLKYEFKTKLDLENQTTRDDTGYMFPDGKKTRNDIPAILSFGVGYELLPKLRATASFNLFFDKDAQWGDENRQDAVNSNSYDLGLGLEYDLTDTISISGGYLHTQYDLQTWYQEDISFELPSDSFGLGAHIRLCPKLDVDVSAFSVSYKDVSQTINYGAVGSYLEKYKQTTWGLSVGLNFHL